MRIQFETERNLATLWMEKFGAPGTKFIKVLSAWRGDLAELPYLHTCNRCKRMCPFILKVLKDSERILPIPLNFVPGPQVRPV